MPGCSACEEYLPVLEQQIKLFQAHGVPFHVWRPGQVIQPGSIPVLVYDAASEDDDLQAYADTLKITATPTTVLLTRNGADKVEGAIAVEQVQRMLYTAAHANG